MKLRSSARGDIDFSQDNKAIVSIANENLRIRLGAVLDFTLNAKCDKARNRVEAPKKPCDVNVESEWASTKPIYVANGRAPAKVFPQRMRH